MKGGYFMDNINENKPDLTKVINLKEYKQENIHLTDDVLGYDLDLIKIMQNQDTFLDYIGKIDEEDIVVEIDGPVFANLLRIIALLKRD